ncbi:Protein phloem 2-like A10 [Vitis vinifera]|uniref:Protein phloem 2-like A10 n=1 Tax=Vitis vinifera TaxID=29760 RepID=A0A438KRI1_VITVI|nr:Protein phloem 2-like A10 [Vitis vinifera]
MLSTTYVAASSGIPHHHLRFAAAAARFRCCQTMCFQNRDLGFNRVYQSPSLVDKRNKLCKLLEALASIVEASSDSAQTVGLVSRDLKAFLESDSDQIPKSLKQLSKIMSSKEFSESMTGVTQAVTWDF